MSFWVILIEMAVFAAIFTAIVFLVSRGNRKYSPAAIHNYPPDIQEEYFKTHDRVDVSYKSKNVILTKGFGVLFANLTMFRLEGTEHMDKAYHQKWFHAKGMLFPGVIFALIPAVLVGWLVTLIR